MHQKLSLTDSVKSTDFYSFDTIIAETTEELFLSCRLKLAKLWPFLTDGFDDYREQILYQAD